MAPQHLELIAEVAEAYSIAFSIEEPAKRGNLTGLLEMLVERGANTKAELCSGLEIEIARGFLR
jgi:hypothetical protein